MSESGLVAAYRLDGNGGGEKLDWEGIAQWQTGQGLLWVHLNRKFDDAQQWLRERSGLDEVIVDALLAEETRPRCVPMGNGLMLFLRGINMNPGADPEDMVSVRLWVEPTRIVSVRLRRLLSVSDLSTTLDKGQGPKDAGEFLADLAERLISRMADVVIDIDDEVDRIQDEILVRQSQQLRAELSRLRREIIALRRYLAPQRDALARLAQIKADWLREAHSHQYREEADRVTRYVEDLDAARERATVTQEELSSRLSEQMNSRMYVLSVVAAIFLPLGFLTGLLGINVGGIPLAESPVGFVSVVVVLIGIVTAQILIFRWRRWL